MAFTFTLASVLRIRSIAEDREARMLQQIQQEIANVSQSVANLDQVVADHNTARSASLETFTASLIHASYGEIEHLRLTRIELEVRLQKLQQLRIIQLATYATARRDREMLTEMRYQQHAIHNAAATRLAQSTQDDNFIARRNRV